jgi:hypothetical protein
LLSIRAVARRPKLAKALQGKKPGQKDARRIADLFKPDLSGGNFIPPPDIRRLRDLCRRRLKLTNYAAGEKNRFQNGLTSSCFKPDDVFTDVFGKSSPKIINTLRFKPFKA